MQSIGMAAPVKLAKKPQKPYADFPLFPHATRRWAKKIRGKLHYFGPWEDPNKALAKYLDERDALMAGRKPRRVSTGVTLRDVCNHFLSHKEHLRDAGEIVPRTFDEYHTTCATLLDSLGKETFADDVGIEEFARLRASFARKWGAVRLGNEIQRIRGVFKYAFEAGLIPAPVRFGPGFARPSAKVIRKARALKGPRMFEADDLRRIIDAAGVPLKAMILLGVNCGFGNTDCGMLPLPAVKLDSGWLDYPRPKTGIARRCPLWPETIKAMRAALLDRPQPKETAAVDRFFVTKYGGRWAKGTPDSPVAKEMRKLLDDLGLHRPGLGFYTLRHVFETIGGESRDQVAVDLIMGHTDGSMASHYRERISDDRLKAVTDHVRKWLFSAAKKAPATNSK